MLFIYTFSLLLILFAIYIVNVIIVKIHIFIWQISACMFRPHPAGGSVGHTVDLAI